MVSLIKLLTVLRQLVFAITGITALKVKSE
jgi:hypothetical protein